MALTRWNPNDMDSLAERLSGWMGRPLRDEFQGMERMTFADWKPKVDIQETPEAFVIKADLPDVRKEDITLSVEDGVMTLKGERKFEKEEKGKKWHRVERSYGSFQRSFSVPENINDEKVMAQYNNGVLEIMMPKAAEKKTKARTVKVG